MSTTFQTYSVDFTATLAATDITFAFRNDPSFTAFDNVSVTDVTTGSSTNLIQNGDFETGDLTNWTYDNVYGATFGGLVSSASNSCTQAGIAVVNGTFEYCDGAVQAYDAIDQVIPTSIGDKYQISFLLAAAGGSTFQQLSTNGDVTDTGGNGIDTLVYVGSSIPAPAPSATPEPASMSLIAAGLIGLGLLRRRK